MNGNFTPGPWFTLPQGEDGAFSWYVIDKPDWMPDSTKWIASAQGTNVCSQDLAEIEANAQLISAAPEMYKVLAKMVADDAFADLCAGIGEEPSWLKDARIALAKAEGRVIA